MQRALSYRTNRDLFSNHYLDEHLPETAAWEAVGESELRAAREDILDLWEREQDTAPQRNESQLEEKFIRPMFRKLGIPFEVEEKTSRTQRVPDYGFFESEDAARQAFDRREEGGNFYEDAVALTDSPDAGGDIVHYEVSVDGDAGIDCLVFRRDAWDAYADGSRDVDVVPAYSRVDVTAAAVTVQLDEGEYLFALDYTELLTDPGPDPVEVAHRLEIADPR